MDDDDDVILTPISSMLAAARQAANLRVQGEPTTVHITPVSTPSKPPRNPDTATPATAQPNGTASQNGPSTSAVTDIGGTTTSIATGSASAPTAIAHRTVAPAANGTFATPVRTATARTPSQPASVSNSRSQNASVVTPSRTAHNATARPAANGPLTTPVRSSAARTPSRPATASHGRSQHAPVVTPSRTAQNMIARPAANAPLTTPARSSAARTPSQPATVSHGRSQNAQVAAPSRTAHNTNARPTANTSLSTPAQTAAARTPSQPATVSNGRSQNSPVVTPSRTAQNTIARPAANTSLTTPARTAGARTPSQPATVSNGRSQHAPVVTPSRTAQNPIARPATNGPLTTPTQSSAARTPSQPATVSNSRSQNAPVVTASRTAHNTIARPATSRPLTTPVRTSAGRALSQPATASHGRSRNAQVVTPSRAAHSTSARPAANTPLTTPVRTSSTLTPHIASAPNGPSQTAPVATPSRTARHPMAPPVANRVTVTAPLTAAHNANAPNRPPQSAAAVASTRTSGETSEARKRAAQPLPSIPRKVARHDGAAAVQSVDHRSNDRGASPASAGKRPRAGGVGVAGGSGSGSGSGTGLTREKEWEMVLKYGLRVVKRDLETGEVIWMACRFCPSFGCKNRKKTYVMAYTTPFPGFECERHLKAEHEEKWREYCAKEEGEKWGFFKEVAEEVFLKRVRELRCHSMHRIYKRAKREGWDEGKLEVELQKVERQKRNEETEKTKEADERGKRVEELVKAERDKAERVKAERKAERARKREEKRKMILEEMRSLEEEAGKWNEERREEREERSSVAMKEDGGPEMRVGRRMFGGEFDAEWRRNRTDVVLLGLESCELEDVFKVGERVPIAVEIVNTVLHGVLSDVNVRRGGEGKLCVPEYLLPEEMDRVFMQSSGRLVALSRAVVFYLLRGVRMDDIVKICGMGDGDDWCMETDADPNHFVAAEQKSDDEDMDAKVDKHEVVATSGRNTNTTNDAHMNEAELNLKGPTIPLPLLQKRVASPDTIWNIGNSICAEGLRLARAACKEALGVVMRLIACPKLGTGAVEVQLSHAGTGLAWMHLISVRGGEWDAVEQMLYCACENWQVKLLGVVLGEGDGVVKAVQTAIVDRLRGVSEGLLVVGEDRMPPESFVGMYVSELAGFLGGFRELYKLHCGEEGADMEAFDRCVEKVSRVDGKLSGRTEEEALESAIRHAPEAVEILHGLCNVWMAVREKRYEIDESVLIQSVRDVTETTEVEGMVEVTQAQDVVDVIAERAFWARDVVALKALAYSGVRMTRGAADSVVHRAKAWSGEWGWGALG